MSTPSQAHVSGGLPEEAGDAATPKLVNLSQTTVLKAGNVFAVTGRDGSLAMQPGHPLGVFRDDCRFVSGHELRLAGVRPELLVAASPRGFEATHELTNPPLRLPGGRVLALQALQVRFERRLEDPGTMLERIELRSYDPDPLEFEVELALRTDFAPMLGIRGIVPVDGPEPAIEPVPDGVRFAATGHDGAYRALTVTASPAPEVREDGRLAFRLQLERGNGVTIALAYDLHEGDGPPRPARDRTAARPSLGPVGPRVLTDDKLFDRVLERSLQDLRMLASRLDGQDYYAAGVPWYATLFGRDSLITAIETVAFDARMAERTLRLLARLLGTRDDPGRDEEPGKVLHELRVGEIATRGLTPLARYYGTVDATPLFLCLLAEHADWSGDLALFRELRGEVERMLGWIDGPGDRNRDGLLEYAARTPDGLRNQGWKDSHDGIMAADGTPLEPPITLVEPQGYVVRAKRGIARLMALDGDADGAARLEREAAEVEQRIERFWLPEQGYYAMALGPDGEPSAALGSNQGHLLWAGAVAPERASAIRAAMMDDRMFSGWGIRTLAEGEAAYNPVGYHLGTVWPHDTALIAVGLRRYGFDGDFDRVMQGMLDAAAEADNYRLPELFAGFGRDEFATPVPYPVACQPQAWAAGAIPYLGRTALGVSADGLNRRLRVRRPSLSHWLDRVEVNGLRVADAEVDLVFERTSGAGVALADVRIRGDLEVVLEVSGRRSER
jgi:glycogen debranching enzyme